MTARTAAKIIDVNYRTSQLFYTKIRRIIAENQQSDTPFQGAVEVDESYLPIKGICDNSGVRKGKRERGAAGLSQMRGTRFGLQLLKRARSDKRDGKIYSCMIQDTKSCSLMPTIKKQAMVDSIVYSDSYRSYDGLDVSGFAQAHLR